MLLALVAWLLPIILIARSDRTEGGEKLLWVLVTLFVSWFAWILYLLVAPIGEKLKKI
ncbi:MAG: PLDc N-terminal domain-containing protein [Gammaproteobacteria bacterium]|nr:PLDc N-terminal domain-containing protein [Gammaproteobacteria bacterium]MCP5136441.1 PLDc N-terminal domain-containing protein [Gammaproteobacteria bacterium]